MVLVRRKSYSFLVLFRVLVLMLRVSKMAFLELSSGFVEKVVKSLLFKDFNFVYFRYGGIVIGKNRIWKNFK